jgi:hypothetical protein
VLYWLESLGLHRPAFREALGSLSLLGLALLSRAAKLAVEWIGNAQAMDTFLDVPALGNARVEIALVGLGLIWLAAVSLRHPLRLTIESPGFGKRARVIITNRGEPTNVEATMRIYRGPTWGRIDAYFEGLEPEQVLPSSAVEMHPMVRAPVHLGRGGKVSVCFAHRNDRQDSVTPESFFFDAGLSMHQMYFKNVGNPRPTFLVDFAIWGSRPMPQYLANYVIETDEKFDLRLRKATFAEISQR